MRFRVFIGCDTPGCPKRGSIINHVTSADFDDPDELETELELFCDSWAGDDPADSCPACRQPGVLRDDPELLETKGPA